LILKKSHFDILIQNFVYIVICLLAVKLFFINEGYLEKSLILCLAFISLFFRLVNNKINLDEYKTLLLLLLLFCSLSFSYFVNENYIRLFGDINTFILYSYLFIVVTKYSFSRKIYYFIIFFIIGFSVLPVLLFFIDYIDYNVVEGFKGFSIHRNHYAIITGFFFIVIIFFWENNYKYFFLILILIGLWLSGSRGTWIGVILSLWFYINIKNGFAAKNILRNISFIVIVFVLYELYMLFKYGVEPHGDSNRVIILKLFFESIKENFWFGVGKNLYFEMDIFKSNVYVHNFLVQIIANYGFIPFVIFITFLILQIKRLSIKGKALVMYILVVGLFQPLFDIRFNPFYLLALLIILYFENYKIKGEIHE
jgi:hypothetical protein